MNKSVFKSTGIVVFSTLLSRIMGLIRDIVISSVFGANAFVDGFWIAFRIPNLFRRFVGEGCLTISFVPVYTSYLVTKTKKESLELAQKTLSLLVMILSIIVGLGIIFSPAIISLFGYGFTDPEQISVTIVLNRIMFPYLFIVSLVAFAMGYLNSHKHFFAPAFSPVLLNVGFIIGALIISRYFAQPLYGLGLGVLLGGFMQFLLQIPYLIRTGFKLKFTVDLNHPGIRAIFRMIVPALFGIAVYQINILMSNMLASMLPAGSISYLYYSDRLTELVLGLFVVSLGNVLLPELSAFAASGNMDKIKEMYTSALKVILFISIPASIALMTAGLPVTSVLFRRGAFNPEDVQMTFKALFYAGMGIPSISIIRITVPAYYSLKDTRTPVIASTVSFVVNISAGYILMQTGLKHGGLTLALSIAATVQMLILIYFLQKKTGHIDIKSLLVSVIKYLLAGIIMAVFLWFIAGKIDWLHDVFFKRLLYLIIIISGGLFVYCLSCFFFRVKEINFILKIIKKGLKYR